MKPILGEALETRRLFAIAVANGVLVVQGTESADVITVSQRGGTITARAGTDRLAVNLADVDEVMVDALGGNDRLTLSRVDLPATIAGGGGDDRIAGGLADDVIAGGDGRDRIAGSGGDDLLAGDAGNDRLLGDAGDDELDGGSGNDLLNGGTGFDLTDVGGDTVIGVEDLGDGTLAPAPVVGRPRRENLFLLRRTFILVDTTGFNVSPGTSTISPFLSSFPAGNQVFVDPHVGVSVQAGGAVVTFPGTGAVARESGQVVGSRVVTALTV